ncbi:hypothetical protein [Candidatus Laterigemmans baculatus]|uniref:hypothetical protein n=1 Tax=Candidatus Laterigemmans baculatus TaxID=2770505 RepID=UPI0013DCF5C9|nr:hypothetical protein [Candidatus Laterigemmans baculatus]
MLAHLRGHLDYLSGHPSQLVTLRAGEAQAKKAAAAQLWRTLAATPRGATLIVDGYEQLAWLSRWRLLYRAWRAGVRLLVTAHRPPQGFYRLFETGTPQSVARRLTAILLDDFPEQREAILDPHTFEQRWRAAEGNVRQLWATLYEDFEHQLPPSHR